MTFKKRAIMASCWVGVSLVVLAVSLVAVFAVSTLAGQKTNVSVSYTVIRPKNYTGSVSLYLKKAGEESYTPISTDLDVSKDSNLSEQITSAITNEDIALSDECPYFILCWQITNDTEDSKYYDRINYYATLAYTDTDDTDTQVTITYYTRNITSTTTAQNIPEYTADTAITTSKALGNLTYVSNATIAVGRTYFYYIKVAISDKYQDAKFSGDFTWTITDAT